MREEAIVLVLLLRRRVRAEFWSHCVSVSQFQERRWAQKPRLTTCVASHPLASAESEQWFLLAQSSVQISWSIRSWWQRFSHAANAALSSGVRTPQSNRYAKLCSPFSSFCANGRSGSGSPHAHAMATTAASRIASVHCISGSRFLLQSRTE